MNHKHIQPLAELTQLLQDHLSFLKASAEAYDQGVYAEAKRMAVSIRVLVHDTTKSKSLLAQLKQKNIQFYDSSFKHYPRSISPYMGLISISATFSGESSVIKYAPNLDMFAVGSMVRTTDFDTWWNAIIFVDGNDNQLTRKSLILSVAEQDGGAHVDPSLNRNYADLSRNNSLGFIVPKGKEDWLKGADHASVRQITHEILKSLIPNYVLKLSKPELDNNVDSPPVKNTSPEAYFALDLSRNSPCPCGSGKRFKHCCGAHK